VGSEFTFFEMILNVFVGTGKSGSPQWSFLVGGSMVVCILGWLVIVFWFGGGA